MAGTRSIRIFAICSRIFLFFMQVLFNYLISDHKPEVFNPPTTHNLNLLDRLITLLFGGFRRWDGIYFLHIAEHGYTYENTLAFFPLFPLLVRFTANLVFLPLQYVMNYASVLVVSAFAVNFVLFVLSADVLYRLSTRVLGNDVLAFKTAQLYCVNPASIFFSAAYSETTFALVTFYGMLALEEGRVTKSAFVFGIGSLVRSNGLVNCGFIVYKIAKVAAFDLRTIWSNADLSFLVRFSSSLTALGFSVLYSVVHVFVCCVPFVAYQCYAYAIFCDPTASSANLPAHVLKYGNEQRYRMAWMGAAKWCSWKIPLSYAYVQKNHWNVDFLEYYERKQWPNIVLAAPIVAICAYAVVHYFRSIPRHCLTLGLLDRAMAKEKKTDCKVEDLVPACGLHHKSCFVYVAQMVYMVTFGLLYMHVQVLTRLIASSCPVVYWFITAVTTPVEQLRSSIDHSEPTSLENKYGSTENFPESDFAYPDALSWSQSSFNKCVIVYFLLYFFCGTAAFSNFMPWT